MVLIEAFRSMWLIATFGCLILLAGTTILFWNEGRAVHISISLDETFESAISIDISEEFDNIYNGCIVHITGPIVVGEPLTEPEYNIQVLAVKLKRRVQMYQWVEETIEHNYGESVASVQTESRTYYYTREWRDTLIDSRNFYIQTGHHNPSHFPIKSRTQIADAAFIGQYELDHQVKDRFNNYAELTSDTRPEDASIKMHSGFYYHAYDIFNPDIGDLRCLFSFAGLEGEMYTIVGKLENNKIASYKTTHAIDVLLVYPGELSLVEIFKQEHHTQRWNTWGWRLIGWLLIFFGVQCTWTLLCIILTRINLLAILMQGVQFPISAIILSFSFSLVIASLAWVLHRPVVGASLFFAATSPLLWLARSVTNYGQVM